MKIHKRDVRDVVVVSLEGRIPGEAERKQILGTLDDLLARGHHKVVVDLSKTEWMASSGIGALIGARQAFLDVGAQIVLAGLTRRIKELIVIARLTEVFEIHDSVDEALTAFTN
jgi:anti-sigma B factor antagonist